MPSLVSGTSFSGRDGIPFGFYVPMRIEYQLGFILEIIHWNLQ